MKTVKPLMNKSFIAKLLVLCMVVGLLPTMALAAEAEPAAGSDSPYYAISADVGEHGTVTVYYKVGNDTQVYDTTIEGPFSGVVYEVENDTLEVTKIVITPDSGYEISQGQFDWNGHTTDMSDGEHDDPVTLTEAAPTLAITAKFRSESSSSVGGGTSSSDSVTGTIGDAVTDKDSSVVEVNAKATASGGVARASVNERHLQQAVDEALAAAKENGTAPEVNIVVDTGNGTSLSLTLDGTPLEDMGKNPKAIIRIISVIGSVTLDAPAIEALAEESNGGSFTVEIAPVDASKLSTEQKTAVGEASVYDIHITHNGKAIANFGGGTLTIGLPYSGEKKDAQVYYMTDGGALYGRSVVTGDNEDFVYFTTEHLSLYVIGGDDLSKPVGVFTDVHTNDWFAEAVDYCYDALMNGVTKNTFEPNADTTRAMVVTTLWRLAGEPEAEDSVFSDVPADEWYTTAVAWAAEAGVVNGYGDGTFAPDQAITREEMATMLYRYAKYAGADVTAAADLAGYTDASEVDSWALDAVKWANAEGLVKGTTTTELSPLTTLTRAQLATFLMRYDMYIA